MSSIHSKVPPTITTTMASTLSVGPSLSSPTSFPSADPAGLQTPFPSLTTSTPNPSTSFAASRKIRNMKNLSLVVAPARGAISAPASPALNHTNNGTAPQGTAAAGAGAGPSSLQSMTSFREQRRTSTPSSFYYHGGKVASSPTLSSVPSTPLTSVPIFTRRENNASNGLPTADPYKYEPVCILPMLYLGTEHNAANREVMSRLRVDYILNVAKEVQNPHEESDYYPDREEPEPMETEAEASSPTLSISSSASSSSSLSSFHSNMSSSSSYERPAEQDRMDVTTTRDDDDDDLDDPSKFVFNVLPPSNRNSLNLPFDGLAPPSTPGPSSTFFPEVPSTPISAYHPMSPSASSAPSLLISPQSPTTDTPPPPPPLARIHYKKLPWTHNQENLMTDFARAFAFIDEARDAGRSVLVHCQCGVSRSASLVIAYVMRARRMTLDQAYAFVKERSPWISPNMGLVYQLKDFEKAIGVGEWGRRASVSGFGARLAVRQGVPGAVARKEMEQARREAMEKAEVGNGKESEAVAELKREVLAHAEGLQESTGRKRSLHMRGAENALVAAGTARGTLMPVEESEGEEATNASGGDAKKRGNLKKKTSTGSLLGIFSSLSSKGLSKSSSTKEKGKDKDAIVPSPSSSSSILKALSVPPLFSLGQSSSSAPSLPTPGLLSPSSSLTTTTSTAPSTPINRDFFTGSAPTTPTSTTSSRKRHQRRPPSIGGSSPRLSSSSSASLASAITSIASSPARTPLFASASFLAGKAAAVGIVAVSAPSGSHDPMDMVIDPHDGFPYTESSVFSPTRITTPPVNMTSFSEVLSSILGSASVASGVAAATSVAVGVSGAAVVSAMAGREARVVEL
ncbi:hypothetical protein BC938DRAFT_474339 [Jimgerdemannia flammicorona]|uniref:protein-tyrosine-phosphatase n=1 Tax=Jimgerdemannia flammicorona TaxID=994334 RepID=A0A433QSN3_9FUNG|nr:hypothetical protein BC938DRAFT_474339 [Jimgerdemannia flammicorona]